MCYLCNDTGSRFLNGGSNCKHKSKRYHAWTSTTKVMPDCLYERSDAQGFLSDEYRNCKCIIKCDCECCKGKYKEKSSWW